MTFSTDECELMYIGGNALFRVLSPELFLVIQEKASSFSVDSATERLLKR